MSVAMGLMCEIDLGKTFRVIPTHLEILTS